MEASSEPGEDDGDSEAVLPSTAAPLQDTLARTCPKCSTVFVSVENRERHEKKPSKYCLQEQVRRSRNAPRHSPALTALDQAPDLRSHLARCWNATFLPDHIPKSTRRLVAAAFMNTVQSLIDDHSAHASWTDLLVFSFRTLGQPKSAPADRKVSLPKVIRQNLQNPALREPPADPFVQLKPGKTSDASIAKCLNRKFQNGDVSGAVRRLISTDVVLPLTPENVAKLREKHPRADSPRTPMFLEAKPQPVSAAEVEDAIISFPKGSAGGIDGLKPQYLKEMLGVLRGCDKDRFCRLLASMADVMLSGEVPRIICPVLYGATLHAFQKKDGGIRPIAVGLTLRRLVAKIVAKRLVPVGDVLRPQQVGYATRGGAEAAVHSARWFLEQAERSLTAKVLVKIDVRNAFNTADRTSMMAAVEKYAPEYLRFVWQTYGSASFLTAGADVVNSEAGIQQGDPLGPVWYCVTTAAAHENLKSEVKCSFLDDDLLGGDANDVLLDFVSIRRGLEEAGMRLNVAKCEVYVSGGSERERQHAYKTITEAFPGISCPSADQLTYLGAPLTAEATPVVLKEHISTARRLYERLGILLFHQAQYLLQHCLGATKLLYTLRCSRSFQHTDLLREFDGATRECYSKITNNDLSEEARWLQCTLPISTGGVGLRSTEELALPAFLASAHSVSELAFQIGGMDLDSYTSVPIQLWSEKATCDVPPDAMKPVQRSWDKPMIDKSYQLLLDLTKDEPTSRARLKAVATKESGLWLYSLPVIELRTCLDNNTLSNAVAQRIGGRVCAPHICVCGAQADSLGHHALSCSRSAGRIGRHNNINAIVADAFGSADIDTELEPQGLSAIDGKRPDGLSLRPLRGGRCETWDVTIVCTLALSHIPATTTEAGAAANQAERSKRSLYEDLAGTYNFQPLAFETMGSWGDDTRKFISLLGKKVQEVTGESRATEYLRQRISLELQRGNAKSVRGTSNKKNSLGEIVVPLRPRGWGTD